MVVCSERAKLDGEQGVCAAANRSTRRRVSPSAFGDLWHFYLVSAWQLCIILLMDVAYLSGIQDCSSYLYMHRPATSERISTVLSRYAHLQTSTDDIHRLPVDLLQAVFLLALHIVFPLPSLCLSRLNVV